jgi:hypothetical protein
MSCLVGGQPSPVSFEILGSGVEAEKLRRRLGCALGGLGFAARIPIHADTERALASGARHDPVALADGKLFVDGLLRTEAIEALLRAWPNAVFQVVHTHAINNENQDP